MSWLIYLVRAAAAGFILIIGLSLLVVAAFSKDRSTPAVAVCVVMVVGGFLSWPRRPNAWRRDPPTDRQLEYATDLGIAIPRGATRGELSDLISQATGEPFRPR